MSDISECPGLCCAAFYWPHTLTETRKRAAANRLTDGAQIADMLIPLTPKQAKERHVAFGGTHDWMKWKDRGHHFTCKNWDEDTRLCRIYEDRPTMCRDFPYGNDCPMGCGVCGGIPTSERMRWREEQYCNQMKAHVSPNPPSEHA
jgi:Fe-S-cluster containining protein